MQIQARHLWRRHRQGACRVDRAAPPTASASEIWPRWQVRTLTASPLRRANIPTTADDDVPPEEKQSYRARAAVLAQWMSETFRAEDLAQGV